MIKNWQYGIDDYDLKALFIADLGVLLEKYRAIISADDYSVEASLCINHGEPNQRWIHIRLEEEDLQARIHDMPR